MRTRHVFLFFAGCLLIGSLAPATAARTEEPVVTKAGRGVTHAATAPNRGKKPAVHKAARAKHATARHAARKSAQMRQDPPPHRMVAGTAQYGIATWYGNSVRRSQRTASGELLDNSAFTAAHLTLPMQSRVRVTNLDNGLSVMVRVTDRGPRGKGRIIDLSRSAAEQLDMKRSGIAHVSVEPVLPGQLTLLPPGELSEPTP
jgi:rare lipoprotein A